MSLCRTKCVFWEEEEGQFIRVVFVLKKGHLELWK